MVIGLYDIANAAKTIAIIQTTIKRRARVSCLQMMSEGATYGKIPLQTHQSNRPQRGVTANVDEEVRYREHPKAV